MDFKIEKEQQPGSKARKIILILNDETYWDIGTEFENINGETVYFFNSHWESIHQNGPIYWVFQSQKKRYREPLPFEMRGILEEWYDENHGNRTKAMIVSLFDNRKNNKRPPNPKTTEIK